MNFRSPPASRPRSRAASSGSATACRASQAPDPRTRDRLTRIARSHKDLESVWTTDAAGKGAEAMGVIVSELGALKSEEDARVAEEANRLTDLTALMHRLSLIAFTLSIGAAIADRRAVLALSHAARPRRCRSAPSTSAPATSPIGSRASARAGATS